MLGISGSSNTYKNLEMATLLKRLAVCVGKFSHSAVNELMGQFCQVYELVR